MKSKVTDVEEIKKQVRKQVAGRVLGGETADVSRVLADMDGCRVKIAAGYGALSDAPQAAAHDRMLWILDGYAEVYGAAGWLAVPNTLELGRRYQPHLHISLIGTQAGRPAG